jgi:hypothetical protein
MAEGRLPKLALKWMPKQKKEGGRPKKNWMEGMRKVINERNLNEGQWILGVGQRRTAFWYIHTHTHTHTHTYIYIVLSRLKSS